MVLLPAVPPDGDPGAFPVDHADARRRSVHHGVGDVPHAVGLPLHGEGIVPGNSPAPADGVSGKVAVLLRPGIGGFHHHHLLAVGLRDFRQDGGKIFQAPVPVGIVGGGKHVVMNEPVFLIIVQLLRVGAVAFRVFRIRKMHRHQRLRIHLPRRPGAGIHQVGDVHPGFLAAELSVRLVSGLHHPHRNPGLLQPPQAVQGKVIHRPGLLLDLHLRPGPGRHLFSGIRPEVGIVEVHQQLHPAGRGSFSDLHRGADVAVSSAEAMPFRVIGIVPYPHPDGVDPVVRQNPEQILLLPVEVPVADAALFLGDHAGYIHAEKKVLRQVFHLPDI